MTGLLVFAELEQANALIVALQRRELQDGGESPTFAEGVPPVQRRGGHSGLHSDLDLQDREPHAVEPQPRQGAVPMAAHFASPGLRYV